MSERRFYRIPRNWEGETCAILASGPSMCRDVVQRIKGRCRAIAVNNQGVATRCPDGHMEPALAPWADVLYAADHPWWRHTGAAQAFPGLKFGAAATEPEIEHFPAHVEVVGISGELGFDDRPTHVRSGGNSGYQAVHVAAHFGARRILLCGFDMHARGGEHWFGDHAWRPGHRSDYGRFIAAFAAGAPEFERRGIEVINCTPGSALACFPFASLDRALERA